MRCFHFAQAIVFDSRFPSKGIFILLFFCGFYFLLEFLFLQTDPYILSHLIYPLQYHVTLVLLYILRRFGHLILLYSHNTLLPKNVYFHIYISSLHVYQKSSMLISLSSIPWMMTHLILVWRRCDICTPTSYVLKNLLF